MKPLIHGLLPGDLAGFVAERGHKSFHARQAWDWLYCRRVAGFAAMSNLPGSLRQELAEAFDFEPFVSGIAPGPGWREGGARKLLLELRDAERIETVLSPSERFRALCVSSQVGCAWACAFCASGQAGFVRNLQAAEMVGQVLAVASVTGQAPTHVVFMGIGEPLENYDSLLRAIRILNDPDGLAIGARRITISTCGLPEGIARLAREKLQVELSVSLHAADDDLRSRLMPVNRRYPLDALMEACAHYRKETGRIITFEYVMIRDVNDSIEQAKALLQRLKGVGGARVNLIPLSAVAEFEGQASSSSAVRRFKTILENAGINATVRLSRGLEHHAACGQLRASRKAEGA